MSVAGCRCSGGLVAEVPDGALDALAALPGVRSVSLDRPIEGTLERTGATIGSGWVHDTLGFDGTGVGVAIIDSGVTSVHDDLASGRVVKFADFVNFQPAAYDDYGHGTHVAGIIAGSGYDSGGRAQGIAPGASLLVEKVLDASGEGFISNVIAAIDYAIANRDALHIRVINLSVAAGVYESYDDRSADARGEARRRGGHRRRVCGRQSRTKRERARAVPAGSAHRATRPG